MNHMNESQVLDEFRQSGALLEGHFILSSGLRSPVYFQKAFVFQHPARTERLCKALAEKVKARFGKIDVVVGPAVGGIIPGYETARWLGCRAIFTEREAGEFKLRRGFEIAKGERVLIVEDVITTGLSFNECAAAIKDEPGEIVGGACIIDRSGGKSEQAAGMAIVSLLAISAPTYPADQVPPELAKLPAVKPGSRGLTA
jgi:orotate phosphoribosyltransferase